MRINVYSLCYNEADLIPWFCQHYQPLAHRIVVYDNHSTDGSPALLRQQGVEVRTFSTGNRMQENALRCLKNRIWQDARGQADWVIVCDFDEFLVHPQLTTLLAQGQREGTTIWQTAGWQLVANDLPQPQQPWHQQVTHGVPDAHYGKPVLFDPQAIRDINYSPGAHQARPTGQVRWGHDLQLQLLHAGWIGCQRTINRYAARSARASAQDRARRWGTPRYDQPATTIAQQFHQLQSQAVPWQ